MGESGPRAEVKEMDWMRTYVSSVLRSFAPQPGTATRILPPILTLAQFRAFLNASVALIKSGTKFDKTSDVMGSTPHLLAGKVLAYLLRRFRLADSKAFLETRIDLR